MGGGGGSAGVIITSYTTAQESSACVYLQEYAHGGDQDDAGWGWEDGLELCHTYSVLTANLFTRDRRPRSNRFDFVL